MCWLQILAVERYDAKALFKKWDKVFLAFGENFLAYGSSEDKAIRRSRGADSAADAHMAIPIAGCVPTALEHGGKMHVMHVSFFTSSVVAEQYFAFANSLTRDLIMYKLQDKILALAAPIVCASTQISAQTNNSVGGEMLGKVSQPHTKTAQLHN